MSFAVDARVPVVFGTARDAAYGDALLVEGEPVPGIVTFRPGQGHPAACACCGIRGEAGRALAGLLQSRAKGHVAFFRRVLVVIETEAGREAVEAALAGDPVASSCYRLIV